MAPLPYFDPEQAPERVLRAMAGKRKINIFRMIANSENSAPEVLALGQTLSKGSSLDPAHREVVILRVAHLTNAAVITANAPDELFDAIRTDYNDSRVVELVLLIGFYMMVARVMNTFHLELENEKVGSY